MLRAYINGTEVTLVVPVTDSEGNSVVASSVAYRVLDGNDTELVAETVVGGFTAGDAEVNLVIPASINTMAEIADLNDREAVIATIEARAVYLKFTTAEGVIGASEIYGLMREQSLIVGVNTFQTYAQAMINAGEITDKTGWDNAVETQRSTALQEARNRLLRVSFRLEANDMSRLSYSRTGVEGYGPALADMTKAEFDQLPAKFKKALAMAQVAEADFILSGDETEELKAAGVISHKVGESATAFRPGKTLEYAVCRKAMQYIQRYVSLGASIGRS